MIYVVGQQQHNSDDFLYYINNHTTPNGSLIEYALEWWFTSNMESPGEGWASEDVEGGGFFATEYEYTDWVLWSYDSQNNVQQMAEWLHDGYAVGITIYNKVTGKGGHCITVWGYEYDNRYDSENPHDYYLGLYVSDSDDRKNNPNPPDLLRYVELSYNTTKGFWEFGSYKISGVTALKPYPESRPKANAGGIYIKSGEKTVDLDGSRSYDDSIAGTLKFRWDFTNDGSWDTKWNFSSTISHTYESDFDGEAKLEVFDGRLRDVDFAYIREVSIEPTLIDSLIQPNKLYILPNIHNLEFRGIYTDPKVQDFYNYNWDFGDGAISDKPMVKHMYTEPGTYLITLTISLGTEVIGSNTISIKVITESAHKTYNINEGC